MSSHEISYQDMTKAALIRLIERCCKGKRDPDDEEMARKEAGKKAELHESHKGKGAAPRVDEEDLPYGGNEDEEKEKAEDEDDGGDGVSGNRFGKKKD